MRAVLQRASSASVTVDGRVVGELARPGLFALVAVTHDDGPAQAVAMAAKVANLRILPEERSVAVALVNDGPFTVLVET